MGRGLSSLQVDILRLAAEHDGISAADVLRAVYGWTSGEYVRPSSPDERWVAHDGRFPSGALHYRNFSPRQMDPQQYQARRVAVSRSLGRLFERGLLRSGWRSPLWFITDAGREYLEKTAPAGNS